MNLKNKARVSLVLNQGQDPLRITCVNFLNIGTPTKPKTEAAVIIMDYNQQNKYRQLLVTIDGELREDNLKSLRFLCEPSIKPKRLHTKISDAFEIFNVLENVGHLDPKNVSYLRDLLNIIGRVDLATMVENYAENSFDVISSYKDVARVDPFRTVLFHVGEDMSSEEVNTVKYLYGKIPKKTKIEEGIDLFTLMLQHNELTPNKPDLLMQLFQELNRMDLVEKIKEYKAKQSITEIHIEEVEAVPESMSFVDEKLQNSDTEEEPMDDMVHPPNPDLKEENLFNAMPVTSDDVIPPANHELSSYLSGISSMGSIDENITVSHSSAQVVPPMSLDEHYSPLECYKMTANPRGMCIIIDNQDFSYDENDQQAVRLGNRGGSQRDQEALQATFEKMKFQIIVHQNLTDTEIMGRMKGISSMDHAAFDCFICCILSHGGENCVFGTNGRKIQLYSITSLFSAQSCPTLAGKPKLFFMASCRGKTQQRGVDPSQAGVGIQTDAPQPEPDFTEWVPSEADFLLGYSTVPNFVSYRSQTYGTFYINELTRVFDQYAHREDLQTLLLRVNAKVAEKIYKTGEGENMQIYKQIPCPQHTLRKQLKFLEFEEHSQC